MYYFKEMAKHYRMLMYMSLLDLRKQHVGTIFGYLWAYVNPSIRILVYWFVFAIGLKGGDNGREYGMWLISGLVPWLFLNDAIRQGGKIYRANISIIKNTKFPTLILPSARLLSLFYIHLGINLLLLVLVYFAGFTIFQLETLQLVYLIFAQFLLALALVLFISPFVAFSKDLGELLDTIMILLFWLTPILWPLSNLSSNVRYIFLLNPMYYIIENYRRVLIDGKWIEFNSYMLYFWVVVIFLIGISGPIYKKLKPIFVDKL